MIEIIDKTEIKEFKPYYELVFHYMVGDGDGNTTITADLSIDNPYIERFCTLLSKLKPIKGSWGVGFEKDDLPKHLEEGQITEDDYYFLSMALYNEKNDYLENIDKKYISEFSSGVQHFTRFSFLVFEFVELNYINENNVKFKTKFV